jgi:Zn-dependent peptidase ImmA (M78 family)/DNA-binding XRE family transcriptional regulator
MDINPRMLIVAREARGMTQDELAAASGVSQGTLSKAQNGLRSLPASDIPRVAQVLRITPEFLCWQEDVYGFGSASFFHRKQQSLSQKTLRQIQAKVNLIRIRLTRLLDGIDLETPLTIPHLDVDEIGSAAEVARRIRAAWRLPMGPVPNLVDCVESAGGVVFRMNFGTHRINAISVWHPGSSPIFVLNSDLSPERQRFVLAHELGHLVMHEGEPPRETAEREADSFAEELLMPAAEIATEIANIDVRKAMTLKPYWRVPMQSLILRAEHLNLISHGRCRSLHAYMNKAGYLKTEPLPIERETPKTYQEILHVHISDHGYSTDELARVMGMLEEDLIAELPSRGQRSLRVVRS